MTYFPSTTLQSVWDTLNHENKVMVQGQLDTIFSRLRQLKKSRQEQDGTSVEFTEEDRLLFRENESITNIAQPDDGRFSVSQGASTSWITFLRRLVPRSNYEYFFSHCDLSMKNIMVDLDDDKYVVSGIIDWETGGFYPEYFESSKLLGNIRSRSETDWYDYLPACIAPERYPIHWLVHRLWEGAVES